MPLALTYSPASHAALVARGEDALILAIGRLVAMELALAATERARDAPHRDRARADRIALDAGSKCGTALMEFDVACRRLEDVGLGDVALDLRGRKYRRLSAMDRAS
jgi:non-ribosomal peptide synthetase component F